jgi:hypothetical protein
MGVPMNWSVVEPAVGIVVSSVPAISAIRHWKATSAYGTGTNSLKSQGHIQLSDFSNTGKKTTVSTWKKPRHGSASENTLHKDDGSEEHLVYLKGISRTTEVKLTYGPK